MTESVFDPARRAGLKFAALSGAGLLAAQLPLSGLLRAQEAPITKPIPSSGERIPVIGLGTNRYGVESEAEMAPLREVLQRMAALGGSVIDTAPGYGRSEIVLGELIAGLGLREKFFLASKVVSRDGVAASGIAQLEESFRRLKTDRLDLMQVHNLTGAEVMLPVLEAWKREGRIRYTGITTSNHDQHAAAADLMRKHRMDFLQINYSIDDRAAADEVLPLAQSRGMAVLLNVPFGGRRGGNLFGKVKDRPLPAWAGEFGARSWAHFFLKYSVSHPAVTAAIPGTTSVRNLKDNQGAGRGTLPDAEMRKRMEAFWDGLA